jgi:hypothetical protein
MNYPPRTNRPVKRAVTITDKQQAALSEAATASVFAVLKDMIGEKRDVMLREFLPHHVQRIAVAAVAGYAAKKEELKRAADLLDDPLPEEWNA